MHLQQIQRPGIGEETQNRECLRFMQEKSIVKASEFINSQRDHEIELRPQPYADNGHWVWPVAAGQHQKNHAHNDATVRGEKTDETPNGKNIAQVRREDSLEGAANPPEICDPEPADRKSV